MIDSRANDVPDVLILRTALKYCFLIIVVPIVAFFAVKSFIFDGLLGLETVTSNVYSAVVAVIILHFTLGLYILRAYSEAEKAPKPAKQD